MKLMLFLCFFVFVPMSALAQSAAVTVWPQGVPPGGVTKASDFGDHALSIYHRNKNGRVEVHRTNADVIVMQSGTATLVSGGTVIEPVSIGPNEIQGSRIEGGTARTVGKGDVIEVPAGVPHQFLPAGRTPVTYLLIKIVRPQP